MSRKRSLGQLYDHSGGVEVNGKQHKVDDESGLNIDELPTHLPNKGGAQNGGLITNESIPNSLNDGPYSSNGSLQINNSSNNPNDNLTCKSNAKKALVPVFGTNIFLETPEDIQQWIEERKKNYPTNKRVSEKQKQQQNIPKPLPTKKPTPLCRFVRNNKTCRMGDNCKFSHDVSSVSKQPNKNKSTKSLVPPKAPTPNGSIKQVFGVLTYIPHRFNNEFHLNVSREKHGFACRLNNREQTRLHEAIVEFAQDLARCGLIATGEELVEKLFDK